VFQAAKGNIMKKIVRVMGHNGVVYEERMTEEQIALFLRLANTEAQTSLGMAFDEWVIKIVGELEHTSLEQEQGNEASHSIEHLL
jgi:hypothetical protein